MRTGLQTADRQPRREQGTRPKCLTCRASPPACPFAELALEVRGERRAIVPARVRLWVNPSAEGYGICRGVVQVDRLTREGQRLADLLGPGDLLGLEGLLTPASASASKAVVEVYTLTEVVLLRFRREDLLEGLNYPPFRDHLLRRLGEALERWQRRCERACYGGVRDRLIAELLELARRFGTWRDGQLWIPLPLRKHHLERLVGAGHTRVTVERRRLEEDGLLRFGKEGIGLPDPARLARMLGDEEISV